MRMLQVALGVALLFSVAAPAGRARASNAREGRGRASAGTAPMAAPASVEASRADDPDSGEELIGRPAPSWQFERWIGTRPLKLENLRGKVVLLRWWTEDCHYCMTTLPVLERLRRREGEGLVVIGVYHPKPPRRVSDRHILEVAHRLKFAGPIAVDTRWTTLERYWLAGHPDRNWTSVSFLIDRDGIIRWVHRGGEYHPSDDPRHARCAADYRELEKTLATVLAEKNAGSSSMK